MALESVDDRLFLRGHGAIRFLAIGRRQPCPFAAHEDIEAVNDLLVMELDVTGAFLEKLDRDTDAVLITLHSQGLIDMDFDRNCSILPAGVHALLMYKEKKIHIDAEAKNKAEHEKHSTIGTIQEHNERKRQSLIAIIGLVISLLSFAFQFGDDLVALLKYFFAK